VVTAATRQDALVELYLSHYAPMVRLAVLLVRDGPTAEDVVQEAFADMMGREPREPAAYLRRAVVNGCASVLRHRSTVERHAAVRAPAVVAESAEHEAMLLLDGNAVTAALGALSPRQRQAVVLRYYMGLSEADTANAMGCRPGSVKSHASRGLARLRAELERVPEITPPLGPGESWRDQATPDVISFGSGTGS
jgi:RNA polymerase sigma-70 factor (sigma-E family)